MDTQAIIIWVVSGVLFIALIFWLVSLAVKSGKKPPLPTTTPYDTIDSPYEIADAPHSDSDTPGTHSTS